MSGLQVSTSASRLIASICRESFYDFILEYWSCVPGAGRIVTNWHMEVLARELQKVAERVFKNQPKINDVVFNVSPGTSKSSIGSILFPAWVWTRMPSARILCASHTSELVLDLAYKSREVIRSDKYRECFPEVEVRPDKEGISLYRNTQGGDRLSCTVGGKTPTGFHAHFLILDDLSDPQRMLSAAERASAADFLTNIVPTRKVDKSVSVTFLIMQRLGAGDPTDVMLEVSKREGSDPVRQVCLPAELTDDVKPVELSQHYIDGLMDPVRLPKSVLNGFRARSAFTYATQFLQQKMVRGGGMFKEEYFNHRVKAAPRNCQRIRFWDRAATGDSGCYTAGVLMALDSESNFYIEHVVKGQWEPTLRNKKILATAHRDRLKYGPRYEPTIVVEMERGSTGLEAFRNLAKILKGFRVKEDRPTGSKDVRAEPLSNQFAAGNVHLVEDGTWDINAYIEEFVLFKPEPGKRLGNFKDQVDASSGAFNLLSGWKVPSTFKVLHISGEKEKTRKIVVCSKKELPYLSIDPMHRVIMVRFLSPISNGNGQCSEEDGPPPSLEEDFNFVMDSLVGEVSLTFADLDPADYQDKWETPVPLYNKKPEELVMTKDTGRSLWSFILKKRQPYPDIYVLCDSEEDCRRALSAAYAISDTVGLKRDKALHYFSDPDSKHDGSPPPNEHVYMVTKSSRGLVV